MKARVRPELMETPDGNTRLMIRFRTPERRHKLAELARAPIFTGIYSGCAAEAEVALKKAEKELHSNYAAPDGSFWSFEKCDLEDKYETITDWMVFPPGSNTVWFCLKGPETAEMKMQQHRRVIYGQSP